MNEFLPDWVSPPGDTIRDILEEKGMDVDAFVIRTGFSRDLVDGLLSGLVVITPRMADKLSEVLGGTAQFWRRRDAQFRYVTQKDK